MLRDTNLAVVVLLSITQHTKAARTCSQAGAQLQYGYAGYGGPRDPGLLPGGRTYCDAQPDEAPPFCDECPLGCANVCLLNFVLQVHKIADSLVANRLKQQFVWCGPRSLCMKLSWCNGICLK